MNKIIKTFFLIVFLFMVSVTIVVAERVPIYEDIGGETATGSGGGSGGSGTTNSGLVMGMSPMFKVSLVDFSDGGFVPVSEHFYADYDIWEVKQWTNKKKSYSYKYYGVMPDTSKGRYDYTADEATVLETEVSNWELWHFAENKSLLNFSVSKLVSKNSWGTFGAYEDDFYNMLCKLTSDPSVQERLGINGVVDKCIGSQDTLDKLEYKYLSKLTNYRIVVEPIYWLRDTEKSTDDSRYLRFFTLKGLAKYVLDKFYANGDTGKGISVGVWDAKDLLENIYATQYHTSESKFINSNGLLRDENGNLIFPTYARNAYGYYKDLANPHLGWGYGIYWIIAEDYGCYYNPDTYETCEGAEKECESQGYTEKDESGKMCETNLDCCSYGIVKPDSVINCEDKETVELNDPTICQIAGSCDEGKKNKYEYSINNYCKVFCREDYDFNFMGKQNVIAGRQFVYGVDHKLETEHSLSTSIYVTKTCYSEIDYEGWENEYNILKNKLNKTIDALETKQNKNQNANNEINEYKTAEANLNEHIAKIKNCNFELDEETLKKVEIADITSDKIDISYDSQFDDLIDIDVTNVDNGKKHKYCYEGNCTFEDLCKECNDTIDVTNWNDTTSTIELSYNICNTSGGKYYCNNETKVNIPNNSMATVKFEKEAQFYQSRKFYTQPYTGIIATEDTKTDEGIWIKLQDYAYPIEINKPDGKYDVLVNVGKISNINSFKYECSYQTFNDTLKYVCGAENCCMIIDGVYYGKDGSKTDYATYVKECENASSLGFVYRSVDLQNLFPNDRAKGSNWNGKTNLITAIEELGNDVWQKEPQYVIELTPNNIKEIRKYNDSVNGIYTNNTLVCDENLNCTSKFLTDMLKVTGQNKYATNVSLRGRDVTTDEGNNCYNAILSKDDCFALEKRGS